MKIGMVTDSLGHLSFTEMLDTAARLGVEFNAANSPCFVGNHSKP